jgi:nicotinate-nucleotide adenylyltransferase
VGGLMRLGIFGGTFDPPHLGHLLFAEEARYDLELDQVLFVLTANPPHKTMRVISPLEYRLRLLKAAIKNNPNFVLSRIDIDRSPPHYAVDTVRLITKKRPNVELIYLMGGDSLVELPTWHDPQGFILACSELGVFKRPNFSINLPEIERKIPGIINKTKFITAPLLEISSSEIRTRIQHEQPFQYFIPRGVYELILKDNRYGKD